MNRIDAVEKLSDPILRAKIYDLLGYAASTEAGVSVSVLDAPQPGDTHVRFVLANNDSRFGIALKTIMLNGLEDWMDYCQQLAGAVQN